MRELVRYQTNAPSLFSIGTPSIQSWMCLPHPCTDQQPAEWSDLAMMQNNAWHVRSACVDRGCGSANRLLCGFTSHAQVQRRTLLPLLHLRQLTLTRDISRCSNMHARACVRMCACMLVKTACNPALSHWSKTAIPELAELPDGSSQAR